MTRVEFVERILRAVFLPTIDDTLLLMETPPGRRPSSALVELSQWFNGLSVADQEQVRLAIQLAVRGTVFGMLTVLDGERSILEQDETGHLELRFRNEAGGVLLNDPAGEPLHDLFADLVPP